MSDTNGAGRSLTLTIVGCGTLSKAIISGMLKSGNTNPKSVLLLPTHLIACVTRESSANSVQEALGPLTTNLKILQNGNLEGVREADVVLLGCKPQMVGQILSENGMSEALEDKLFISILAGVPIRQIQDILTNNGTRPQSQPTKIVRVMPNTASAIGESMSVITSSPGLPKELDEFVTWMFDSIGRTVKLPENLMDVSTALCGSGPAFFSLMLESMIDGAVAMGLPRKEAQMMAAQTMKGAAGLVLQGEHPALLRDKVSTPGGCTIGGLLVLEEGRVRGNVARAVREATVVAEQLGRGVTGVNGTRF
ncbi:MAG: hypothetical protein GOMPHAMPRED_003464 [Gomphillus americanus]|uniref:Pyrroline-5-carboxylate reductase n=1 Tax=Gomphillus americanus TaxID=1940652 RepID=A0A8H3IS02_9LECA|nr:MAG: hypothetical protein GOMPHAMPRED_003464 [Gomphillus americanus]